MKTIPNDWMVVACRRGHVSKSYHGTHHNPRCAKRLGARYCGYKVHFIQIELARALYHRGWRACERNALMKIIRAIYRYIASGDSADLDTER